MTKRKVKYADEPLGKVKVIPDFLPKPSELVAKEETVKVTLLLTKDSVDFFKKEAEEQHTQYQKMIRVLVDMYAYNYNKAQKKRKYA
jgi:intracellular sulfur oxidation DsrE/DsrF family protein